MHRLIEFIKRIYVILLFLLIEVVALWCYATATPYTESKIMSRTTRIGGAISGTITDIQNFMSLPEQNDILTSQIAKLEHDLQERDAIIASLGLDSLALSSFDDEELKFRYHPARVVSMTANRRRNHVILDKGEKDGIAEGMGVITPDRKLVGNVVACSENYSVVMPLLNTRYKTGGRLVDNDYVCSIYWSGDSRYEVTATELSKYAEPRKGMIVNVESDRMPLDIMIGTIESCQLNASKSAYKATITIAADMSRLDNLLIVENRHLTELNELIKSQEE